MDVKNPKFLFIRNYKTNKNLNIHAHYCPQGTYLSPIYTIFINTFIIFTKRHKYCSICFTYIDFWTNFSFAETIISNIETIDPCVNLKSSKMRILQNKAGVSVCAWPLYFCMLAWYVVWIKMMLITFLSLWTQFCFYFRNFLTPSWYSEKENSSPRT